MARSPMTCPPFKHASPLSQMSPVPNHHPLILHLDFPNFAMSMVMPGILQTSVPLYSACVTQDLPPCSHLSSHPDAHTFNHVITDSLLCSPLSSHPAIVIPNHVTTDPPLRRCHFSHPALSSPVIAPPCSILDANDGPLHVMLRKGRSVPHVKTRFVRYRFRKLVQILINQVIQFVVMLQNVA